MTKSFFIFSMAMMLLCVWTPLGETSSVKCCTNYSPNPLPLSRLKDYTIQDATKFCRLNAVIFTTIKDKRICADPEAKWVKNGMNHILRSIGKLPKATNTAV